MDLENLALKMEKKQIERTCIISRDIISPDEAIRLTVGPEQTLVFDLKGNLPGQGYWVKASRSYFEILLQNPKKFKRIKGAKMPSDHFLDDLVRALEKQILQQIGLARRAGQLVFGFEKIKLWLKEKKPALILVAKDGSEKEISRLGLERHPIPVFRLLTKNALGRALGREHVVHIILKHGRLAQNINRDCQRLAGFLES